MENKEIKLEIINNERKETKSIEYKKELSKNIEDIENKEVLSVFKKIDLFYSIVERGN